MAIPRFVRALLLLTACLMYFGQAGWPHALGKDWQRIFQMAPGLTLFGATLLLRARSSRARAAEPVAI